MIIPGWRGAHERPPQDVLDAIVAAHHDGALSWGVSPQRYREAFRLTEADAR